MAQVRRSWKLDSMILISQLKISYESMTVSLLNFLLHFFPYHIFPHQSLLVTLEVSSYRNQSSAVFTLSTLPCTSLIHLYHLETKFKTTTVKYSDTASANSYFTACYCGCKTKTAFPKCITWHLSTLNIIILSCCHSLS